MLSDQERKKIWVTCWLQDTLKYSLLGLVVSFVVGERNDYPLGLYTIPLVLLVMSFLTYLIKYMPNIKADNELRSWRGQEYEEELSKQLENHTYAQLLKSAWFTKHLHKKEKEDPPSLTKFMK